MSVSFSASGEGPPGHQPSLRAAQSGDISELEALIERSVRALLAGDHSPEAIERSLQLVFGVDRQLIADGTYFVIADGAEPVACGGWSFRKTLFGADNMHARDDAQLLPGRDAARIRAMFVAPEQVRRGLGSRLLDHCEAAAEAHGFDRVELGATLAGERLYARRGYQPLERLDTPLGAGLSLPVIRMEKRLAAIRAPDRG
jgi:GNAT superfamily N-acetyltransferase